MDWSLPLWERGLKFCEPYMGLHYFLVAPLVGAWIEITEVIRCGITAVVAPLVGAWIEIHKYRVVGALELSLPLWERGLKYRNTNRR